MGVLQPNWFLALRVPPGEWFERRVPPAPEGFRRFHADDLHVTLAFLGACGEARARCAWQSVELTRLGSHRFVLGGVVPMGNPRRYSALSILPASGQERLEAEIDAGRPTWLAAAEARPERRPAKAHITVARPQRGATDAQRSQGLEWSARIDVTGIAVELDELVLYTWSAQRSERLFEARERRRLAHPDETDAM